MAKIKDSCEGCQCMKLKLLMGPVTLSRHWSQKDQPHHFPVETEGCWEVRASVRTPSLPMLWDHRRWSWERTQGRKLLVKIGVLVGRYKGLMISFCIYHMNTYLAWLHVLTIWVFLKTKSFLSWKVNHWGFGVRGRLLWIAFFTVFPLLFLILLSRREDSFILFASLLSYVNKHPGLALMQRIKVGILSKVHGINTWFYILQIYLTGSCGVWFFLKMDLWKWK